MCLSEADGGFVEYHDDVELSDATPFDGEGLDLSVIPAAQRELETFPDPVHRQDVAIQGVSALFEHDGRELSCLAKLRRSFCQVAEEPLIGCVESLEDFLSGLRMEQSPRYPFCKRLLHLVHSNVLAVQMVVSLLERQGMIPDKCSLTEHPVKMLRFIVAIELVFVCNHNKTVNLLAIYSFFLILQTKQEK